MALDFKLKDDFRFYIDKLAGKVIICLFGHLPRVKRTCAIYFWFPCRGNCWHQRRDKTIKKEQEVV